MMYKESYVIYNNDQKAIMLIDNNLEADMIASKIGGAVERVFGNDFSLILSEIEKNTIGYSVWFRFGFIS